MFKGSGLLRAINFNSNPIEEIEHGSFRGVHINTLRLSHNCLETLLTDAFTLNQIASLYIFLDHGQLNSLPYRAFDNCPVDTSIFMDDCKLTRIDKGVFDGCSTIGTLSLQNNQISYIDDEAFDSVCIIHGL
ncbi:uncharacterized protein [Antedon mediterranea]|uniref:uncharacterized protein n=1 Tax=Antedon mediterranea TaxID=105859 RepID=UPI003AF8BCF9